MSKKPIITETPGSLQVALRSYVKGSSDEFKKIFKDAFKEAIKDAVLAVKESGVDMKALKELEKKGDPADLASRETYVTATDGTYNPAAENTQEKLSQENMAKVGYVDPDAAARKEYFRKKNGG